MAGLLTGSQQRRDCQSTTMLKGFKVKKQIQKKKILDIIFILLILTNTKKEDIRYYIYTFDFNKSIKKLGSH